MHDAASTTRRHGPRRRHQRGRAVPARRRPDAGGARTSRPRRARGADRDEHHALEPAARPSPPRSWRPGSSLPGFPKADVVVVRGTSKAAETRGNLVVRYRGSGARKPVLFFAHLDVVEARREDWSLDPFVLTEKDGYFYGRGTIDVKGGAATLAAAFLRLRQESFVPDRDMILAFTADEEGGDDNGVEWLLANRRELIDAAYAMNVDTGGGEILGGRLAVLDVQAAEKVFASFTLTAKNPGGHSSMPPKDNAIYRLAAGLQRLAAFEFPVQPDRRDPRLLREMAPLSGADQADMAAVARATPDAAAAARLSAKSAVPQRAAAHHLRRRRCCRAGTPRTRCRRRRRRRSTAASSPARTPARCRRRWCGCSPIRRSRWRRSSRPRPVRRRRWRRSRWRRSRRPRARRGARRRWCRSRRSWTPARPTACYLRTAGIPVYGTTGIAYDPDDYRAHGKDERILVKSFDEGWSSPTSWRRPSAPPHRRGDSPALGRASDSAGAMQLDRPTRRYTPVPRRRALRRPMSLAGGDRARAVRSSLRVAPVGAASDPTHRRWPVARARHRRDDDDVQPAQRRGALPVRIRRRRSRSSCCRTRRSSRGGRRRAPPTYDVVAGAARQRPLLRGAGPAPARGHSGHRLRRGRRSACRRRRST